VSKSEVNDLGSKCDCEPRFLPFHERATSTLWSAYCPSCKRELKWDINIKTKDEAVALWAETFGEFRGRLREGARVK